MHTIRLARHAMATRFEIVLHGEDPSMLRSAGGEALDEIEELDGRLSFYSQTSEVARLNALAHREPLRLDGELFALLRRARELCMETDGAFDMTIGPLMKCWGMAGGQGRFPTPAEIDEALARTGSEHVGLDPSDCRVAFACEGLRVDLGSIGKGFALDRAAETLREAGIQSALLHGGTSTVCAIGAPPEAEGWTVAIEDPHALEQAPGIQSDPSSAPGILTTVTLRDESLSVSAVSGKGFEHGGRFYGHVIDPRTGHPTQGALLAAVVLPTATDSDALATALLVLGAEKLALLQERRPDIRALVLPTGEPPPPPVSFGIPLNR